LFLLYSQTVFGFSRSKQPKYHKAKSNVGKTFVERKHMKSKQIDKNDQKPIEDPQKTHQSTSYFVAKDHKK